MKTSRRVAFNTLAQLIGKVATMATTVVITILVTRRFGPAGYGELTLMTAYAALFYVVADFGLNAIAVREFAAREGQTTLYFGNLISLRFFMALVLSVLGVAALVLFPYSPYVKIGILISLLTVFTQALYTSTNCIFQSKLRYDLSVAAAILGSLATLAVALWAVFQSGGILLIAASYVAGGAVTVASAFWLVRGLNGRFKPLFNLTLWRNLLVAALPLGITTIFSVFLGKADTMILSVLRGSRDVGLYGAAYKIFEVALVFPTFFANSIYPVLIRHREEGVAKLVETAKKSGLVLLAIGLAVAAGGFVLAPLGIRIVGGADFLPSVLALRLLFLGIPVFYLSALFLWLLITLGEQKILPLFYGLGALFNIIANIIFIPRFGFYGSAVITWVSEALILSALAFWTIKTFRGWATSRTIRQ